MLRPEYPAGERQSHPSAEDEALQSNAATQGLFIQVLSLSIVSISPYLASLNGYDLSLLEVCLLQALIAIGLSCVFSMPVWWHAIHGLFPLLVGVMLTFTISPAYYLFAFVTSAAVYWTSFRSQVPYYPSSDDVVASLQKLLSQNMLPRESHINMIDIGSGLGGVMMQLSKAFPHSSFSGIEIAPLPWALSVIRNKLTQSQAEFLYGDYQKLDFADYDVVYAYLSPAVMSAVWQKALREMTPGSLLISNEFNIIEKPADSILQITPQSSKLFVWHM